MHRSFLAVPGLIAALSGCARVIEVVDSSGSGAGGASSSSVATTVQSSSSVGGMGGMGGTGGAPVLPPVGISVGAFVACAVDPIGEVECWGLGEGGLLGDGVSEHQSCDAKFDCSPVPVQVLFPAPVPTIVSVQAGYYQVCALSDQGQVYCWGHNDVGQLGASTPYFANLPLLVSSLPGKATAVAVGEEHVCALLEDGNVWCWGLATSGQLGALPSGNATPTPLEVQGLPEAAVSIAAGFTETCAITISGALYCWGASGQPTGAGMPAPEPLLVTGLEAGVTSVSIGVHQICAVKDGAAYCSGQDPMKVPGTDGEVVQSVTVGPDASCLLLATGVVDCWGKPDGGMLGDAGAMSGDTPSPVLGFGPGENTATSVSVSGEEHHACLVTTAGEVQCWGDNALGELGHDLVGGVAASPVAVVKLQ